MHNENLVKIYQSWVLALIDSGAQVTLVKSVFVKLNNVSLGQKQA